MLLLQTWGLRYDLYSCRYATNVGGMLRPPCRQDHSMGQLLPNRVSVQGKSWRESSTDIAIAGLGWVGVGVSGQAALDVWTYQGLPSSPHLHSDRTCMEAALHT